MSFKETEASVRYEIIDGKKTAVITPECIVTLTNIKTGVEYNSDAEAQIDIDDPTTDTKKEYSEDNQRQINRALNSIIEQLNSTYLTENEEEKERFSFFFS